MTRAQDTAHHFIVSPVLKYETYRSPTATGPAYISGSNVLLSQIGYAEKRPGLIKFENVLTTFTGDIRRLFTWRRWGSDFFLMANEVTATQSQVWKLKIGTDSSFVAIFTSNVAEPFDFVVSKNFVFFGNGTDMRKYDGTSVTKWGISTPATAPSTATSGTGISATVGYKYKYLYSSSVTGHYSSPSPESVTTGIFTNKQVDVTVTASTDSQVDQVRIFRTTDGGGGVWFEIVGSPFTNTSGAKTDTTTDANLSSATVPTAGFNDPPPASKGMVWYANRIWMFETRNVWFTGWEEISNGVAEEAVPSGPAGNFWAFDSEVTGLAAVGNGVLVFTANRIYKIEGDSLDTFRRLVLADGLGCRERSAIASIGELVAWLDSSSSVWSTNGRQIEELSIAIRPDLDGIVHSSASMQFFASKTFRWLLLLDGGAGKLRIFDIDREAWLPPWTIGGRSLWSGETSLGTWDLLIGHSTKNVLKLSTTTFSDNGASYSGSLTTTLFNLVPENAPGRLGETEYISLETNTNEPSAVSVLVDDDPFTSSFTSITSNKVAAPLRTQGTGVLDNWYYSRSPSGRRMALKIDWPTSTARFKLYSIDIAYALVR